MILKKTFLTLAVLVSLSTFATPSLRSFSGDYSLEIGSKKRMVNVKYFSNLRVPGASRIYEGLRIGNEFLSVLSDPQSGEIFVSTEMLDEDLSFFYNIVKSPSKWKDNGYWSTDSKIQKVRWQVEGTHTLIFEVYGRTCRLPFVNPHICLISDWSNTPVIYTLTRLR